MFELLCMSFLTVSYFVALSEEKKQEKIKELKIKVFCYAIRHKLLYNEVVEMLQNKTLTFEDIEKDSKEYEKTKGEINNGL